MKSFPAKKLPSRARIATANVSPPPLGRTASRTETVNRKFRNRNESPLGKLNLVAISESSTVALGATSPEVASAPAPT